MIQVPNSPDPSLVYRVYKYPTGAVIPPGSIYLYSTKNGWQSNGTGGYAVNENLMNVWHYFLVCGEK